jgi:hypothetical protein
MKMDVRHELPAAAEVAWNELHSEAYVDAQRQETGTAGEVVFDETQSDGTRIRRTRITLGRELPSVAANLIGSKRLAYTLEEEVDSANHRVKWRVIIDRVSNKVKAAGIFALEPISDSTCQRIVSGEIKVSVPLVGGRIERGIADELTKSYEATAVFACKWLSERS